ncbi:MAG TPA: DEDD exonuclease domain-containing protein [Propionibacteriaceae bacterium]|nr:DEDD exonuclease domain-containing protein [Propionibacteriaceae bacterium]
MSPTAAYRLLQPSLDDLGVPLAAATFVVVDLETTGGSGDDAITEIGAVKVCGGEIIGEFQTLVNPGTHIPGLIAVLTGITNQMVADAPRIKQVIGPFLEFASGSILVAHNAGFDVGFLKRACQTLDIAWPGYAVIDTVALARQALLRDEVANCKLATLAAHFHATTLPNHRALSDARATVDVLHGLLERVGNLGVSTVEDLTEFTRRVSPQRRAKRVWANDLPSVPGVYCFVREQHDGDELKREVLYVGKSTNIRTRVRSYFTAAETRARMDEMVRVSTGVEAYPCATDLEAEIRELRMIASHSPRYNRRSRNQHRLVWVKLTREPFPRLSIVRTVASDGADYLGPFPNRQAADEVCLALYDAFPIRQCSQRLSARTPSSDCALGEMGRCLAPCRLGVAGDAYPDLVARVRVALGLDVRDVLETVGQRLGRLVTQQRFEEAQVLTSRLQAYTRAAVRLQRIRSLARCSEIVAAVRRGDGWDIHVFRHGRLAAAAHAEAGVAPQAMAREALATAETVLPLDTGLPSASIEETERIAAWLERPGVRLIEIEGDWSWPLHIGLGHADLARHTLGTQDVSAAG